MATSTATILFTDIEGSTETRARIGEAAADAQFLDHTRRLTAIVERHGGRVLKTAGDGVMASLESATEAVAAAIEIQRAAYRQDADMRVRVGVASGDVSWEGNDCFGLPVITAARLQAAAEGGQILVSQVVRWLAGERSDARLENVGLLELKGLPDPVEAFSVLWEPSEGDEATACVPMPPALGTSAGFAFVGRDDEWAEMEHAWHAAQAGERRMVLLGGEAGAGKTRLAVEFARRCHADGAAVLYGSCDQELVVPYQPWVQSLDHLLCTLDPADLDPTVAMDLGMLAPLLSRLDRRVSPNLPGFNTAAESERYRLYAAVEGAFAEAARRWPVVLVIDDLHWGSSQTLALLSYIARSSGGRILVVGTFRDTGDEITGPLADTLADLRRSDCVTRIRVRGLDSRGVESFVAGVTGSTLDADLIKLAADVSERTLGNAFFVGEMWRHLTAAGVVAQEHDKWVVRGDLELQVPDSIREVVTSRLGRLDFKVQQLAELVAVAGRHIEMRALLVAADLTAGEVSGGLDALTAAGLVEPIQRPFLAFQFTHVLVRDAVASTISATRRVQLHLRVAEALESIHEADPRAALSELARHYAEAAAVGASAKAIYYGKRAAEQATASIAWEEAMRLLETTLELTTPGSIARAEIMISLADAKGRLGRYEESRKLSEEAFHIARETKQPELAGEAAVVVAESTHVPGLPGHTSVAFVSEAIRMLGDEPTLLRCKLESALALSLTHSGRAVEALQTVENSIVMARALDDDAALVYALGASTIIMADPHQLLAHADLLNDLAKRQGDPWYLLYSTTNQMRAYTMLGDMDAVDRVLVEHRTLSDRASLILADVEGECFTTMVALARGRFEEAESAAERGFEIGEGHYPGAAGVYGMQMFVTRREQGRLAEVAPILEAMARTDEAGAWRPGLAILYAELGRLDDARRQFDALAPDNFAAVARDSLWPGSAAFLSDVCIALGDGERARSLYTEMLQYRDQNLAVALTVSLGPADRLLGGLASLLGNDAAADEHFRAALDLAERAGAPAWKARVQHDWGRHHLKTGNANAARPLLVEALETADELGMAAVAASCGELRLQPAVALTSEPIAPDDLSNRELDVLRLIAEGCSNREIGERLNISGNTAANHVRAILQKTGCANRAEAAAYAVRQALLDQS